MSWFDESNEEKVIEQKDNTIDRIPTVPAGAQIDLPANVQVNFNTSQSSTNGSPGNNLDDISALVGGGDVSAGRLIDEVSEVKNPTNSFGRLGNILTVIQISTNTATAADVDQGPQVFVQNTLEAGINSSIDATVVRVASHSIAQLAGLTDGPISPVADIAFHGAAYVFSNQYISSQFTDALFDKDNADTFGNLQRDEDGNWYSLEMGGSAFDPTDYAIEGEDYSSQRVGEFNSKVHHFVKN